MQSTTKSTAENHKGGTTSKRLKVHLYLPVFAFLLSGFIGLLVIWINRLYVYADPIDYLTIAQNYVSSPWTNPANGYWSPLLPAILAVAFRITGASQQSQLFVADAVLYFTYIFVLVSYAVFNNRICLYLSRRFPDRWSEASAFSLFLFGFSSITAASLSLLANSIQPDLLLLGFFILSCSRLVHFRSSPPTATSIVIFSATLALGYLAKAIYFPLGFVFILCFYGCMKGEPRRIFATAGLLMCFLFFSSIQWLPLSLQKNKLTFGDTGKINYVASVDIGGEGGWVVRQTSLDGAPLKHPVRIISDRPRIYEFGGTFNAPYPLTYDPSYWMEGLHLTFNPVRQIAVLLMNVQQLLFMLCPTNVSPGISLSFLTMLSLYFIYRHIAPKGPWLVYELIIPSCAGFGAYFITVVLYRYVAGFIFGILIALFIAVLVTVSKRRIVVIQAAASALFVGVYVISLGQSLEELRLDVRHKTIAELLENPHAEAARALSEMGISRGSKVAEMGGLEATYFPSLAGAKVVSLLDKPEDFWEGSMEQRSTICRLLASTGAQYVISPAPLLDALPTGWRHIGNTGFILFNL